MTSCLIVDPAKDAYCGRPATDNFGKLAACDQCADDLRAQIAAHHAQPSLEDRMDRIEELMRNVIRATAMLAEAADRPRTAASLRELL